MEIDKLISEMTGDNSDAKDTSLEEVFKSGSSGSGADKDVDKPESTPETSKSAQNKEELAMEVEEAEKPESMPETNKSGQNKEELAVEVEEAENPAKTNKDSNDTLSVNSLTDQSSSIVTETIKQPVKSSVAVKSKEKTETVKISTVKEKVANTKAVNLGSSIVIKSPEKKSDSNTIEVDMSSIMTPQLVTIPEGVDPGSVSLPPNMQLMVADTGEYYLVPQQPEGATVALAQDSSGEVKMVTMPAGTQEGGVVVIGSNPNLPGIDLGSSKLYFLLCLFNMV